MVRPKKKGKTNEEKLAKDSLRKRTKYEEIKNNPELYRLQKEKERKRYLLRKANKKILSIQELSERDKRERRLRWRKYKQNYVKKLKEKKKTESIESEIETDFNDDSSNEDIKPNIKEIKLTTSDPLTEPQRKEIATLEPCSFVNEITAATTVVHDIGSGTSLANEISSGTSLANEIGSGTSLANDICSTSENSQAKTDSLDQFGIYLVSLLRQLPRKVAVKLQGDFIGQVIKAQMDDED